MRSLSFTEALLEAQDQILENIPEAFIIGEGVPDPKGVFGTTKGLAQKYPGRVFDSPVSEAGVTGLCIGAALNGMKPIMVHQRMDFSLYAMDQIVNNMAKWHSMFGFQRKVPMVIRMTVGRGWGAGNQHAQNLEALFAHIPGLQIVVPHDGASAKGLLIASVQSGEPTIFIEHKWLHNNKSNVDPKFFPELEPSKLIPGKDATLVAWGASAQIAKKAAELSGVELVILNKLSLDSFNLIYQSVHKTKKILVISDAWKTGGFASEIIASVAERFYGVEYSRLTLPDKYSPSSHLLAEDYYFGVNDITRTLTLLTNKGYPYIDSEIPHDIDPNIGKVLSAI